MAFSSTSAQTYRRDMAWHGGQPVDPWGGQRVATTSCGGTLYLALSLLSLLNFKIKGF